MSLNVSGFGAYDLRGVYPESINQEIAYRIGRVFPELFNAKKVAVGHDIRLSGPTLNDALIRGLTEAGCDVYDIGQCGTEMIYFTTGFKKLDGGIMITASHNPKDYNGMKFVREEARPISSDTGLFDLRDKIADESRDWSHKKSIGTVHKIDIQQDYIKCLLTYIDLKKFRPLKIVINTGNGAAGPIINELEKHLPFEIIKIQNDPNGFFPNGVPNPILEDSRAVTAEAVVANAATCGIAFDGDFDRCFLFDEKGGFIEGYYMVGLLAGAFLKKEPDSKVVYEPRMTWNTIEIVKELGGTPVISRSGHAFMKAVMRSENAIYGGEMASHHYFRDFYFCDSGMIPWLIVLEMLSQTDKTLSQLMADRIMKHPISGEINTKISSTEVVKEIMKKVEEKYSIDGKVSKLDGLAIEFPEWRFSLRGSNTEPLIRLNVETKGNATLLKEKTAELLSMIRS